jgi:hypothetical protein
MARAESNDRTVRYDRGDDGRGARGAASSPPPSSSDHVPDVFPTATSSRSVGGVAGAGPTRRSGDRPARPPGLRDEDAGGTGPTTTSTSTSDRPTAGAAGSSSSPDAAAAAHDDDGKWDAYASFECNHRSSDDDEGDSGEDEARGGGGGMGNGNDGRWDAFESFEMNYRESSSGSGSDPSDSDCDGGGGSDDEEGGDGDYDDCDDCDDCDDDDFDRAEGGVGERMLSSFPVAAATTTAECVDLVDTDDDNDDGELVVEPPKGKENNAEDERFRLGSRKRRRREHRAIGDLDSDSSSLSEVECVGLAPRRYPSHARSTSTRPSPPPWQTSRRTPIRGATYVEDAAVIGGGGSSGRRVSSVGASFPCMNARNDLTGGSGAGVNGHRLFCGGGARRDGDAMSAAVAGDGARVESAAVAKSAAASTVAAKRKKTSAAKSKGGGTGVSTKKKAVPAKKRRKSSSRGKVYKRKKSYSKRPPSTGAGGAGRGRAASTTTSGAAGRAWSARECGIRPSSGTYMTIAKQEPLLRNVGGGSIQF